MTNKEYLRQAYRLDKRINSDIEELARLREMAVSISVPSLGEKIQTSYQGEAPFVRCVEKILILEEKINREIEVMVGLKGQMRDVIAAVPDMDERLVLRYRYIHNMTWEQIGDELNADRTTVYRWHNMALRHVVLPENPVRI